MFAVESLMHRLREGTTPKVIRKHPRPRDGLEHGPMGVHGREHSQDHRRIAKSSEHNAKLARRCDLASKR